MHLRRKLLVQPHAAQLDGMKALQRDVECRVRRVPDGRQRLVLVFIIGEEVELVLQDRPAVRPADLLIRVGQDALQHRIWRVELAVPKAAHERSRKQVGSRLCNGVHLHARRSALGRVEPVRDELEFRDRIVAVPGLIAGAQVRRHLLTVDVELELPDVDSILYGKGALGVGPVPRRQQGERHPVATLRRQLRHLPRIDVAAQTRRANLDERCLPGHRQRF